MRGFIEVHENEKNVFLINVNRIDYVEANKLPDDTSCTIYLNTYEKDYVTPLETYIEVLRKIEEAMK